MVADITALACEIDALGNARNCTFIVASGDGDLLPAIERALERGISVEVWSWQRATSNKLRRLHEAGRAKFVPLDEHAMSIGFVDELWNDRRWRLDDFADSAVVVKNVDPVDVADACRAALKCEWWHSLMPDSDDDVAVILRPCTADRDKWFELIKTQLFADRPQAEVLSYIQYKATQAGGPSKVTSNKPSNVPSDASGSPPGGNRFDLLRLDHGGADSDSDSDSDSDKGSGSGDDVCSRTETAEMDDKDSAPSNAPSNTPSNLPSNSGPLGRKPIQPIVPRPDCRHGYRCARGLACSFAHTEDQQAFFREHGGACPRGYKLKQCAHAASGRCKFMSSAEWCTYAHGEADAWCVSCQCGGHSAAKCTAAARPARAARLVEMCGNSKPSARAA